MVGDFCAGFFGAGLAAATGSSFFAAGFDAKNESRNDGGLDLVAAGLAAATGALAADFLGARLGGVDLATGLEGAGLTSFFGAEKKESKRDGGLDLASAGLAAATVLAAGLGGADFLAATGAAGFETSFGLDSKRESRNDGGLDLDSTFFGAGGALFLATRFGGAVFFATGAAGLGFDSKIESSNDGVADYWSYDVRTAFKSEGQVDQPCHLTFLAITFLAFLAAGLGMKDAKIDLLASPLAGAASGTLGATIGLILLCFSSAAAAFSSSSAAAASSSARRLAIWACSASIVALAFA